MNEDERTGPGTDDAAEPTAPARGRRRGPATPRLTAELTAEEIDSRYQEHLRRVDESPGGK